MASTIAERLVILASAKADMASAIVEMGGTVPSTLLQYGDAVRGITTEGVASCFVFTSASTVWPDCVTGFLSPPTCLYLQNEAFKGFPNLSAADLTYGVKEIWNWVFMGCSRLQIAVGPLVQGIGQGAFMSCPRLSMVSFPSCSSIGTYAFASCYSEDNPGYSLTWVSFPVCQRVQDAAFLCCSALFSASFPKASFIGESVFAECSRLSTVYVPEALTLGDSAFYNAKALSSVSFPLCETVGANAFYSCALTALDFPKCTVIGSGAFSGCAGASYASFPACQSIGAEAFADCLSLRRVDFTGVSAVPTLASGVFYPASSVTIVVPSSLYSEWVAADNWSSVSSLISSTAG